MKKLDLLKHHGPTGLLFVALCMAPIANAAQNLATFEFNEGPGSATTKSKDGRLTGTLGHLANPANYPVLASDSPSAQAGDNAVLLSGTQFFVVKDVPNRVAAVQTAAFTVESWVKFTGGMEPLVPQGIVGYGGSYKLGFRWNDSYYAGTIVFTAFGVADIDSHVLVPTDANWHHIAAAWQPGVGVTFYLDGAVASVVEFTGTFLPPTTDYLTIGGERENNPVNGLLDRVRIHKKFLTAEELDAVATTPKSPLADTVVAFNFNETTLPCKSAVNPALSTITSEDYRQQLTRPIYTTDTPSGLSSDYALQFTRTTFVVVSNANEVISMDPSNPSFTLETWAKFGVQPINRTVLFGHNGPGGAFTFSVTADRRLQVTTLGVADIPSNATVPDDGLWHHIAVVHEAGKEVRFYIDGALSDTVAYTGGMIFDRTEPHLSIGCEPSFWSNFVGLMDRLRITSGVLTPEQLDCLPIPGVTPGAPVLTQTTVQQITWPTFPVGYTLQSSPTLDPASAVWSAVTAPSYQIGTNNTVYVPMGGAKMFYRLVKP